MEEYPDLTKVVVHAAKSGKGLFDSYMEVYNLTPEQMAESSGMTAEHFNTILEDSRSNKALKTSIEILSKLCNGE
jgi:hypothetical protein